jgi:hypothetical protein
MKKGRCILKPKPTTLESIVKTSDVPEARAVMTDVYYGTYKDDTTLYINSKEYGGKECEFIKLSW